MNRADFDFVRSLVKQRSAIVLDDGKEYLADARLAPVAHQQGFASVDELVRQLRTRLSNDLSRRVVEAMATNETSFFRDGNPFEALRKHILPALIERRSAERTLRIWCAACSTGQEPYSVAMLLREHFPQLQGWRISLLASDLGIGVLDHARTGRYSQLEVNRGLPPTMLEKYFQRCATVGRAGTAEYQIDDSLRTTVDFRPINLIEPWPAMAPFDIVMLRNVLIYFDAETRKTVLRRILSLMRPDAYLLLGGSENSMHLADRMEPVQLGPFTCCRLRIPRPETRDPRSK